ncbi:MAG: glycerol-3-phosphate 1-O-acyltransferase [Puniceicoccaceae bacterium]|nr:MAG: glycerol-3-phosphate 1-O-acyltransferase [Puniceicoccaceae bacterium]
MSNRPKGAEFVPDVKHRPLHPGDKRLALRRLNPQVGGVSFVSILIVVLVGYLIGSVSFAVIIARSQGVDIFKVGSGNPGATNVKRALGKKWGNLTFALDALKGFAAAGWPLIAYGGDDRLAVIGLIAAILGHSFSVFLKFRGGKGVATAIGGLLALMWPVLLIGLAVWLVAFYTSKVVALASILFALSLPIAAYFFYGTQDPRFYLGAVLAVLIVVRHRSNIARMFSGQENRF